MSVLCINLSFSLCTYIFSQILSSPNCNLEIDDSRFIECLVTPPAQRVQFILGEEVGDDAHESHPLFSEMEELVKDGDEMEWKETAR